MQGVSAGSSILKTYHFLGSWFSKFYFFCILLDILIFCSFLFDLPDALLHVLYMYIIGLFYLILENSFLLFSAPAMRCARYMIMCDSKGMHHNPLSSLSPLPGRAASFDTITYVFNLCHKHNWLFWRQKRDIADLIKFETTYLLSVWGQLINYAWVKD